MRLTLVPYGAALLLLAVASAPAQVSHPFLLFSSSDTATIAARVRSDPDHAALFSELRQEADRFVYSGDWPSSDNKGKGEWYENLPALAFAYLMTHDTVYADRARHWMFNENTNSWNQGIIHDVWPYGDRPIFRRIIALAFVYDWIYERLTESERALIRGRIIADLNFDNPAKPFWGPRTFFNRPQIAIESNWVANAAEALLLGAMAVYGEDASYDTVQAESDIRLAAQHAFLGESSWLGRAFCPDDGSYIEGVSYALWEGSRLPVMIRALSRWDDINYFQQPGIRDRLSRLFDWLSFEVLPGEKTLSRMFNNFNAAYKEHRGALTVALTLSGEYTEKAGIMQWVFDNTIQNISDLLPGTGGEDLQAIHGNALFFIMPILEYAGTDAVDPGLLFPTSKLFPRIGLSYIRTSTPPQQSWAGADDIQFALTCQPALDPVTGRFIIRHDQANKNSITLSAFGCDFIEALGYNPTGTWPSGANYILMDVDGVSKGQAVASTWDGDGIEVPDWLIRNGNIVSHYTSQANVFLHGDAKDAFSKLYSQSNGVVEVIDDPSDAPALFAAPHSPDKSYLNPVLRADRFVQSHSPVDGTLQYFVVADDISKDNTPRTYRWLCHSPYGPSGTNPVVLRDNAKGAELLLWEAHAEYSSLSSIANVSVGGSVLDPGAPYLSPAQPSSTTNLPFESGLTVDPYFHVILLPKRTSSTAPEVSTVAMSNGSCFQIEWPGFRDFSILCHFGTAVSSTISSNARLAGIRKNLSTGTPFTFAMGEGSSLWFEDRQLVDLFGTVGSVLKDQDSVRIYGSVSNYRVYSPATSGVLVNNLSVDFVQNGDYVEPSLLSFALHNMSASDEATSASNQRKLFRESAGTLHEVFESGGEVFYRRSTDGGSSWHVTSQLSNGSADNVRPCLSSAGTTVIVIWTRPADDDRLDLLCARSTDGGITWPTASTIQSGFRCWDPGPIPSVSLYSDGSGIVLYRTTGGIKCKLTNNYGSTWGSATSVPGTAASWNMPSSAIYTTYWSTKQANVAYATDLPENAPQICHNYYDYQTGSWGSATDLCAILPMNFAHHANPSLAVSASESHKTVHVAWDAEDTQYPGSRVLIHREGGFRNFPSVYSALSYQGESKPSITGVTGETAWMAYQNTSGTSIWKRFYDGTYWTGSYGTWVGNGRNPQISVGSTTAKYLWTEGTTAPYQIQVGSEALGKEGDASAYSRALNVIVPQRGGVSIELGTPVIVHTDGSMTEIPFAEAPEESSLANLSGLLKQGWSSPFAMPADADSLVVPVRILGFDQTALLSSETGLVTVNAVDGVTGTVLKELTRTTLEGSSTAVVATFAFATKSLGALTGTSNVQLRPEISGVKMGSEFILSLGHIYRQSEREGIAKGGQIFRKQEELPTQFLLHPNYPNPFNPSTRFTYDIAEPGEISLVIHDMLGRVIGTVVEGHREPGRFTVEWNARHANRPVSSGVYLAQFRVRTAMGSLLYSQANRIIVVK